MGGHHVETTTTPMGTVVPVPPRSHRLIGLALGTIAWAWIFYRFKEEGRMRFVIITLFCYLKYHLFYLQKIINFISYNVTFLITYHFLSRPYSYRVHIMDEINTRI